LHLECRGAADLDSDLAGNPADLVDAARIKIWPDPDFSFRCLFASLMLQRALHNI